MALSDRQILDSLSRTPFNDSAEMALLVGEPHATVHRALTALLADGIVGRVSHGTTELSSSRRYYLTAKGVGETAVILGFETPSSFVRAYPVSREWLALLIRRMDAVAVVYRLASSLSPGTGSLRSHADFHRRGRFDATITPHGSPGRALRTESPSRKRASIPRPERMVQAAPTFGINPSEKRTLDLATDHPMILREHPVNWARCLGGTGQPDDAQPRHRALFVRIRNQAPRFTQTRHGLIME